MHMHMRWFIGFGTVEPDAITFDAQHRRHWIRLRPRQKVCKKATCGFIKSSLLTQWQHLLRLRLRFWGLIQQIGNAGPSAHLQARGDPLQTHGRFLAKAARQHDL
jgi:hypothetical protein